MSKVSKVKEIQVRCMRCQEWVTSPISFEDSKGIDMSTLIKTRCQCPRCGDMTSCNIKNVRVRDEKGRFVGIDA